MSVLIVPSSSFTSVLSGISLRRYRRALADELGIWQEATTGVATGHDASRVVLADEWRDDEAGYTPLGSHRRPAWLYVRTGVQAGQQRRILTQQDVGYQGSRSALVLSRPFSAPLPAASVVEVTAPLPVKRHVGIKGLDECINEALERIWIEARVSIDGNGTREYDLGAYPYLWDEGQIVGIYDHRWSSSSEPVSRSAAGYRLVSDGPTRTLVTELSYGTSETFELALIVRASHLTHDGLAWSYDTVSPGLSSDEDLAAAPERWVLTFAVVKALQFLRRYAQLSEAIDPEVRAAGLAEIETRLRVWAAAARHIQAYEFPSCPQRARSAYVVATQAWD